MSDTVTTKISLRSDRATGISAVHNGANINGMAFNIEYISEKSPEIAKTLIDLYEEARALENL